MHNHQDKKLTRNLLLTSNTQRQNYNNKVFSHTYNPKTILPVTRVVNMYSLIERPHVNLGMVLT